MPRKILIVDDSETDRIVLSGMLAKEYTVVEAENGQEAYAMLISKPNAFSVVISDIMMPVMNGYELTASIRKNGLLRQVPVILTTGDAEHETIAKAMTCGANNYILKPFKADLVLAMVKNTITLKENSAFVNAIRRDKLTGLYNRSAFMSEIQRMLLRREAGYYIMSSFDIDHFKVINDQYGVQMGDKVLKHLGDVFKEGFSSIGGVTCRISDDKFAAFYPADLRDSDTVEEIRAKASRVEGLSSPISFSIGRYIITDLTLSPSIMYDRAVLAGETVKDNYIKKIAYFDERIRERLLYEQQIVSDMERALREGEFEPWFQPQYNHATGALIGSEALVRWRKDGKIIPPVNFIHIFEKNGFIYQVDMYVWRRVCQNLRMWLDSGQSPLPVSVNISRFDLFQKDFYDFICSLVKEYELPVELLRLEITESSFSESPQQIVEVVTKLVEYGFTVEIDDFGSDYSSLNTLKDVPAQVLKLDMRFLEKTNSLRGGNIIESVVRMAKWLGMTVIAEGVEELEQSDYLSSIGCNYIQGYLYAKPMPLEQFETHCDGFKKEPRLLSLETVENLDQNTFWDPSGMETLIFNSYVGGACIFEYHNGSIELIRINKKYAETFCPDASVDEVFKRNILENMDEHNRNILLESVKRAIDANDESVCETVEKGLRDPSEPIYIRSTIRVIARSGDHYLLYGTIINLTEQRVAEQRRNEFSERIQLIMENVNGGICAVALHDNGEYVFLFANDNYYSIAGYTKAQAQAEIKDLLAIIHPDDREYVKEILAKIRSSKTADTYEYRCIKRDGSVIYMRSSVSFADMTGYGKVSIFVLTDITETVLSKQSAQQLAKQLRVIIDNAPGGVTAIVQEGDRHRLIFSNDKYYEQLGVPKEEFEEKYAGTSSFIVEEDRKRVFKQVKACEGSEEPVSVEFRIVRADGELRYMSSRISFVEYPGVNKPVQLAVTSDVTEQVESAQKEQSMLEEMQSMMADMPGGFVRIRVENDGRFFVTYCNEGFCKLVGMDHEALKKRFATDLLSGVHPDDKALVKDTLGEMIKSGEAQTPRYRTLASNGKYVYVSAFGRYTKDRDGNSFMNLYFTDAEAREKEERQREMFMDNFPWGAGIYSFENGEMGLIYQNKGFWELVGLSGEDCSDADSAPMSAIHPDDIPLIMQKLAVGVEHREDIICDIRLKHLKLGYRPVRLVARVVQNENGGFIIIATFVPNEQVEMSYQLILPRLLSAIMESSNDYTFAKDKDMRYICCSPAFLRIAGLKDMQEAVGKTDYELFPREMAKQFRENDNALMKSDKPMVDFDETVYSQDGEPHYCLASKHILRNSAGEAIGIYGVSRDITKEHSALEQLQLVNDGVPGGIATYSFKDGVVRVVYCNDGFCKLFGGTRKGLENRGDFNALDWVFEEDRAKLTSQIERLAKKNVPMDIVFRIHVIGGGYKWINEKATTVEHRGDSVHFNAILVDVTERQTVSEQLRISEEENSLAVKHGGSVVCRFDVEEKVLTLPENVAAAYSLPEKITDVPYGPVGLGKISAESVNAYIGFFEAIEKGSSETNVLFSQCYLGSWRWMEGKSSTIFSDEGKPVRAIISFFDVTDKMEQEAVFRKWQDSIKQRAPDSYTLFRCNLNKNESYEAKEGTLFTFNIDGAGISFNERSKTYANKCVHWDDREKYISFVDSDAMLAGFYRGRRSDSLEYRELLKDRKEWRWLKLSIDLVDHPNTSDVEAFLMYENIDETKRKDLEEKERAENDPLTGVLNRAAFEKKMNESIYSSPPDATHALLMLDIDGFKLVNDVFGHGAGDQTLIDVAEQMQKILRREDYVGRLGGDEFVVFLTNLPNETVAAKKAQQICELAKKSYSVEVQISGSVGIAVYPNDGDDFESLYKKADATLYYVKGCGKNNFAFYREGIEEDDGKSEQTGLVGSALKKQDIKRRMLIVDDNLIDCELMQNLFKDDFRVDVVRDGASALTKIHHYGSALSVILLDLIMPGMNGYAVLERMQQDASCKGIPVVVVSASDDHDTLLKVVGMGATDLITKPIDVELLRIRVNSAISKVENERLRAQNSLMNMLNDEIISYQSVFEEMKTAVIVCYWINGSYLYSPNLSTMLAGKFDSRPLWRILLSDMIADTVTVRHIQQYIHNIANNREEREGEMTVKLRVASGAKHDFDMKVYKQVNEFGITDRMIMTLKDMNE